MYQYVELKYFNPGLNIGLVDIKNAWLLSALPVKLRTSVHRGGLVFRLPGPGRRISYCMLKKGLIKKIIIIQPLQLLPFRNYNPACLLISSSLSIGFFAASLNSSSIVISGASYSIQR